MVRDKQMQPYVIVKQTLIAFMNGALPQIALEHGRKTISAKRAPDDRRGRERGDLQHADVQDRGRAAGGLTDVHRNQHATSASILLDGGGLQIDQLPMLQIIFERMATMCADGVRPLASSLPIFS